MQVMNPCKHCGAARTRGRGPGLCQRCYGIDEVRRRHFPPVDNRTNFNGPAPLPASPTSHPPGSPGKVAVLVERFARRESLFHPDDAQGEWERVGTPAPNRKPGTPSRPSKLRAVVLAELAKGAISIRGLARRLGHRSPAYVWQVVRQLVREGLARKDANGWRLVEPGAALAPCSDPGLLAS